MDWVDGVDGWMVWMDGWMDELDGWTKWGKQRPPTPPPPPPPPPPPTDVFLLICPRNVCVSVLGVGVGGFWGGLVVSGFACW